MITSRKCRPRVVIMLKEPHPNRVKTRLGRTIGMVAAAWWFRHQTRHLIRRIQDPRWELILAVSPDTEGGKSRIWPQHLSRIPQGKGDLGKRMQRAFASLPRGPVCIIGADIPHIERTHIAQAFAALGQADAVFGPAPDGGYWLIGLKRNRALHPQLFKNVRWSTPRALADTRASIAHLQVRYIKQLQDVDVIEDLHNITKGHSP